MLLYLPEPENKYCCLCNREPGLCPFRVEAIRLPRGSQGSIWAYQNATRFGLIGGFDLHHRRRTEKLHETTTLKMWLVVSRAGLSLPRLEATQPSFSACASGPPTRLSVSASQASSARLVEPVGSSNRPLRQIRTPHEAALLFGGEGGIRTHVPGLPDHLISSQRRYGHFGTSPDSCVILPVMRFIANLHSRSFAN